MQEQQQVATAVSDYQQLAEQLVIQSTDTPEQIIQKARSLRQLGRIDDAVAAFTRYGELFAADPTTAPYVPVAQAFARQSQGLQISDGAYIYGIADGSVAQQAGMMTSDILISYNGQPTTSPEQTVQVVQAVPAGTQVTVEWLRLDPSGRLIRQRADVHAGKLGVALMLL